MYMFCLEELVCKSYFHVQGTCTYCGGGVRWGGVRWDGGRVRWDGGRVRWGWGEVRVGWGEVGWGGDYP